MIKILLDPGHHDRRDNRYRGYSEAATMLSIAKRIQTHAQRVHAMQVDLTRRTGSPLRPDYAADLRARGERSEGYDLFLSLHSDAGTPSAQGNTLYGNIRPEKADVLLFDKLSSAVAAATGVARNSLRYREDSSQDRYIVHTKPMHGKENYYAVLRHAKAARSCLLELGFHTNDTERALLADPAVQERIAAHLADAIAAHFGAAKKQTDPNFFLEQILPDVLTSAAKNHLLPSLILAQAMLESGHGTSELAQKAHNLFGIKASPPWKGESYPYKGDTYRKYPDIAASIADHGAFFTSTPHRSERYKGIPGETDPQKAVRALAASGYAEDPAYGGKISRIIEQYGLTQYDAVVLQTEKCPCEWSISLLKRIGKHREVKE